jgi:uncharacterized protein YjbJ (UPF0337 family)
MFVTLASWGSIWLAVAAPRLAMRMLQSNRSIQEKRGEHMNQSTKDELEGKAHELKGAVKEATGKVTNQPELEADGQNEKLAGTIQKKVGQVEKVLGS